MALVMTYTDPGIEVIMSFHNKKTAEFSKSNTSYDHLLQDTFSSIFVSWIESEIYCNHLRDRNLSTKKRTKCGSQAIPSYGFKTDGVVGRKGILMNPPKRIVLGPLGVKMLITGASFSTQLATLWRPLACRRQVEMFTKDRRINTPQA